MRSFTAVVEKCKDTGLFSGYVPGLRGAYTQGETLEELHANLKEVIELVLESGETEMDSEFVKTQLVEVP